jgi:hypothetical protein
LPTKYLLALVTSWSCDCTKEHDSGGEPLGLGSSLRLLLIWCHVAFDSGFGDKEPLLINVLSVKHIVKGVSMIEDSTLWTLLAHIKKVFLQQFILSELPETFGHFSQGSY